jgi:LPXTG-motif cell wall-anchored protein
MILSLLAPAAGANYARIEARAGCDRAVVWRASASVEGGPQERTNERVAVEYRPSGADDDEWRPAGPIGRFDEQDGYSFTGSFNLPSGVDAAEVRVTPLVKWGPERDGDPPGEPRFATVEVPADCATHPLAATQELDCATGSVAIRLRNVGDQPLDAEVGSDRIVTREISLGPGAEQTLAVPVLVDRETRIQVRSGTFVASDQVHAVDCSPGAPAAVVVERCTAPLGRLVVLATGGAESVTATISVRGSTVDTIPIAAGTSLQRTLEVPAESLPVEVRIDGTVAAAGAVGGCDGPVAGLLSCGTAGRPACDLSATQPAPPGPPPELIPPLQIDHGAPVLPRTGPAQRAVGISLAGLLLLGGGMALAARDRRRPTVSALSTALAPYRQRWWDES